MGLSRLSNNSPLGERKRSVTLGKYKELPEFPKEIFLDLTSFCNHTCVFCANPMIKNKTTMDAGMVYRVLGEAYECGVRELGLYATGESFLVKNLADYVDYAKSMVGYDYVFITTNGALATPEIVKPVLDAGLDSIKFSISAGTRESYKKIQGRDDFDTVIQNLKWVSTYRSVAEKSYRIYVTMVYTDTILDEVNLLESIVSPYIDEWDPHQLTNQCGNMPENNLLGNIPAHHNPRGRGTRKVCYQPFKGFTITPEGFVSACVIDYSRDLIVGDLHKNTLREIWEADIYKNFRRRHLKQDLKGLICYNCMHNTKEPVKPLLPEYGQNFRESLEEHNSAEILDDPNTMMVFVSERTQKHNSEET